MNRLFYKPPAGWAGDYIPLYDRGRYRLFYLQDWRDHANHGEGTPWYRIDTGDFTHFTEHGEMLARGTREEQDLYVFTGSALYAEGRYHIFYTGHNPYLRQQGRPEQGIMHAVSDDLDHWTKLPEETFFAPTDVYEPHDWRDPFVFWNEEAGEYGMLLAARLKTGPSRRRGCTAYCASRDLVHWESRGPLWAPGLYFTHECPDLFRMGDWWYLIISEFTEASLTRYRMSRSLQGPWLVPPDDAFDGRALYAAKTASDGDRRYLFGWNPTREGEKDDGNWQWGGHLVVHELWQRADGTLAVRPPEPIERALNIPVPFSFENGFGDWSASDGSVTVTSADGFACAVAGALPSPARVRATLQYAPGTRACGLVLRASDDLEEGYYVRLEPNRQRLVFDRWPRPGDRPYMAEIERPLALEPERPITLEAFVEGTVCEIYVDGEVAMSTRLYNRSEGAWGVFVMEGRADFTGVTLAGM